MVVAADGSFGIIEHILLCRVASRLRSVQDALSLDGDGEMMAVRGQQHEKIENPSPRLEGWCPDVEVSGWKDHLGATISEVCVCVRCTAGANAQCELL